METSSPNQSPLTNVDGSRVPGEWFPRTSAVDWSTVQFQQTSSHRRTAQLHRHRGISACCALVLILRP